MATMILGSVSQVNMAEKAFCLKQIEQYLIPIADGISPLKQTTICLIQHKGIARLQSQKYSSTQ